MKTSTARTGIIIRTQSFYRLRMAGIMLLADLTGLFLATMLGNILVYGWMENQLIAQNEIGHIIVIFTSLVLFMTSRLYPGTGINPADEIRLVFRYNLAAFALGVIADILLESININYYYALISVWLISTVLVLAFRWFTRIGAVKMGIWKEPVMIVAKGPRAASLVHYFRKRLRFGYWPVLAVSDDEGVKNYIPFRDEQAIHFRNLSRAQDLIREQGVLTALVDISSISEIFPPGKEAELSQLVPQIIILSEFNMLEGVSLQVQDFEGLLGVAVRKNELSPVNLAIKLLMDISLSALGLLLLAPFFGIIVLCIKLDSRGSVFYCHERIGKNNRKIRIIKFRTMCQDADKILRAYLQNNPEANQEWLETQKLKHDPRLTQVGKILRKFSIDELPQLINVLKGDLSLVGARPIVQDEIHHYGKQFEVYTRTRPGLTGLWQVSGRNNTTYAERVRYDTYYIHNWSIWLDIYILLRTVWVVASREGAY